MQQERLATLVLVDRLPDCGGLYVHYTHRVLPAGGWEFVDVRAMVEERHEIWLDELVDWHERLTVHARSTWWWLLPASRLHIWQEPVRPMLFALGILELLRRRGAETIYAVGCPAMVGLYVEELSKGTVSVKGNIRSTSPVRRTLRRHLRQTRELVVFLGRIRRRSKIPISGRRADLLVFSLGLGNEVLKERGDHYFGRVFDNDNDKDRVQWLYQYGHQGTSRDISAQLEFMGRRSIDSQPLTWIEAQEIIGLAYLIRRDMRRALAGLPELRIGGTSSSLFPFEYFTELALSSLALLELAVLMVTRRLLSDVRPSVVAYPYEEKGLDRAILTACRQHDSIIQTVGLAHAVYNPGLLYMREPRNEEARPPRPSVLAVTGAAMRDWLRLERRADEIVVVGSPRVGSPAIPWSRSRSRPLRVLLLGGFVYELERLADWLELKADLFADCEVSVRAHPYGWSDQQRAAVLNRLSKSGVQFVVGAFAKQVADSDVVLFCASSAGIEAILLGRLTVCVALHDLCPTDPFAGKVDGEALLRCRTPEQLKCLLQRIGAMPDSEYLSIVNEQRRLAGQIYEPFRVEARKVFGLSDAASASTGELKFESAVAPIA